MNYLSGENIQVGDNVQLEHGKTTGVVQFIIQSDDDMKEWNLDEQGLLIQSEPFGSVFWPLDDVNDPIVFISRGKLSLESTSLV